MDPPSGTINYGPQVVSFVGTYMLERSSSARARMRSARSALFAMLALADSDLIFYVKTNGTIIRVL